MAARAAGRWAPPALLRCTPTCCSTAARCSWPARREPWCRWAAAPSRRTGSPSVSRAPSRWALCRSRWSPQRRRDPVPVPSQARRLGRQPAHGPRRGLSDPKRARRREQGRARAPRDPKRARRWERDLSGAQPQGHAHKRPDRDPKAPALLVRDPAHHLRGRAPPARPRRPRRAPRPWVRLEPVRVPAWRQRVPARRLCVPDLLRSRVDRRRRRREQPRSPCVHRPRWSRKRPRLPRRRVSVTTTTLIRRRSTSRCPRASAKRPCLRSRRRGRCRSRRLRSTLPGLWPLPPRHRWHRRHRRHRRSTTKRR